MVYFLTPRINVSARPCETEKHKIASFHSMLYDYFIKNFKNTFCIDCLLIVSFRYKNSLQQMFEVSSLRANTDCRRFLHSLTAASTTLCCRPLQTSTSRCLRSSTLVLHLVHTLLHCHEVFNVEVDIFQAIWNAIFSEL